LQRLENDAVSMRQFQQAIEFLLWRVAIDVEAQPDLLPARDWTIGDMAREAGVRAPD
jgi:hypothetical protein